MWRDPRDTSVSRPRWYCRIEDYHPFPHAVPWKHRGKPLEQIPQNMFRDGVRTLPVTAYRKIVQLADLPPLPPEDARASPGRLPPLNAVRPTIVGQDDDLLALVTRGPGGAHAGGPAPRSPHRRLVGTRAEEIAHKYLSDNRTECEIAELRYVAKLGETPGWDIEYRKTNGESICVEVKGTTARQFVAIEITAGEWDAARLHRDRYQLCLVADCFSRTPQMRFIRDPYTRMEQGDFVAMPLAWRLQREAPAERKDSTATSEP